LSGLVPCVLNSCITFRSDYFKNKIKLMLMAVRFCLFLLLFSGIKSLSGQTMSNTIIDTIELDGRSVVLLSGKKWAFLDEYQKSLTYDTLFSKNWITKEIHSYPSDRNRQLGELVVDLHENNSDFIFPLDTFKVLRGFSSYHTGLDLKANSGDSIRAAFDGRIRFASNIGNGYGNLVIIRHYNGLETYYSHLSKILVGLNDDLKAGEIVGLVGATGRATGPHLHFETRFRDRTFDPLTIVNCELKCLASDSLKICNQLFGKKTGNTGQHLVEGDGGDFHTIIKGDTLYKIAKLHNTSIDILCQLNNISKTTILQVGRKLIIP